MGTISNSFSLMNNPPRPEIITTLVEDVRVPATEPRPRRGSRLQEQWLLIGDSNPYHPPVARLFAAQNSTMISSRSIPNLQLRNSKGGTNFTNFYNISRTLGSVLRRIVLRLVNVNRKFDPKFPSRDHNEFENLIQRYGDHIRLPAYYWQTLVHEFDSEFAHFNTEFNVLRTPNIHLDRTIFCISPTSIIRIHTITTFINANSSATLQVVVSRHLYEGNNLAWRLCERMREVIEEVAIQLADDEDFLQGRHFAEMDLADEDEEEEEEEEEDY